MADWSKPALTDQYVNFLTYMKALTTDLAKGCDPAKTTITNPFVDMTRWNSASGKWEKYSGTAWGDLAATYNINVSTFGGKAANLYALLNSPNFSGTPQCPTADPAANNLLLANTAFVQGIKAALVNGAPGNMSTLAQIAASLGNNPAFITSYNTDWSNHLNATDPHGQYAYDSDLTTHTSVAATTASAGHVRLATNTETTNGTATNIATHPAGVAAAIAAAMSSVSGDGGISVFTANGTFVVPNGVTTIYVSAVAGGGGGAGTNQTIYNYGGTGGGGGAGCYKYPLAVSPGQQLQIVVGGGGQGGFTSGSPGGATSIGSLLTLGGGGPGAGNLSTISYTNWTVAGGTGPSGNGGGLSNGILTQLGVGCAGVGACQSLQPGQTGHMLGGAGARSNGNNNSAATNGNSYGGGGSGWSKGSVSNTGSGGNGAPGVVIIEW